MNYEIPKIPLGPTCQVAQRVESNPSRSNRLGRTQTRSPLLARETLISLSRSGDQSRLRRRRFIPAALGRRRRRGAVDLGRLSTANQMVRADLSRASPFARHRRSSAPGRWRPPPPRVGEAVALHPGASPARGAALGAVVVARLGLARPGAAVLRRAPPWPP